MELEKSPLQEKKSTKIAGMYIHIPFCKQACHYCDFHFSTSLKNKGHMSFALCNEIKLRRSEIGDYQELKTIYFGGGTPSILPVTALKFIIDTIYENYLVSDDVEITIEANPDDLTEEYLKDLAAIEVNRLSIGIQSFFDEDLTLMNRAHNRTEASECLSRAKKYFDNISIDLIYGIPGMSAERWKENLKIALDAGVPHISSYALTIEPNTALFAFVAKGKIIPLGDELTKEHFDILVDTMEKEGFEHYEFSNFGKLGYFSRNNIAYWQGKEYLGIGPSAHSYNGQQRSWNINNNSQYIKALNKNELPKEIEDLSIRDKYNEYVMTGLRTAWGVSIQKVEDSFGIRYREYILKQAQKRLDEGLLSLDDDTLFVTKKGKFLTDGIASDLFLINFEQGSSLAMKISIDNQEALYDLDLSEPLDISIPLRAANDNVNAWYIPPPTIEPVIDGDWIGKVSEGATTNFNNISFNPHGHGTHTECVGHIIKEFYSINDALKRFFFSAEIITVKPEKRAKDYVITINQIKSLMKFTPEALIIRTLPNDIDKIKKQYSNTNWPYLTKEAAAYIREQNIKHLLIDLPSVDKEKDKGKLLAHRAFWNYPENTRWDATITEMIFVKHSIADGLYVLNLQIASFENDASPSKPILYKILK